MANLVLKIKHNANLTDALNKAVIIANFGIHNRNKLSSANVKDVGLPSAVSNQILRKYGRNKKCKHINPKHIKLVAPAQSIKTVGNIITIIPRLVKQSREAGLFLICTGVMRVRIPSTQQKHKRIYGYRILSYQQRARNR